MFLDLVIVLYRAACRQHGCCSTEERCYAEAVQRRLDTSAASAWRSQRPGRVGRQRRTCSSETWRSAKAACSAATVASGGDSDSAASAASRSTCRAAQAALP